MTQPSPASIQATTDIVDGNLRLTANGYYAEYRVSNPRLYRGLSRSEKLDVGTAHHQLFRQLIPHNPLIGGFLRPETEAEIVAKSLTGEGGALMDARSVPQYAQMVIDRIQALVQDAQAQENPAPWPRERELIVAFPVGKNLQDARINRDRILSELPTSWRFTPAQPEDMEWLWTASINRGVLYMPAPAAAGRIADFTPAYFDDGAKDDRIEGYTRHKRPAVLKITPENGAPAYQVVLKVNFPTGHMPFPGGTELFAVLDRTRLHADWVIQCEHIPYSRVVAANERDRKTIESNKYETELEPHRVNDDAIAEELLNAYEAKLAINKGDSVRYVALIAVGGPTLADVNKSVNFLSEVFDHLGISFERIAGLQTEMWSAMLPGNPVSMYVNSLADELDIEGFSEMVPFTSSAIGSRTGPIYGRDIKSGLGNLFRIDTRAILENDQSSNLVVMGGLGAGKTTLLRTGAIFDSVLNHLWFAYDRTELGEFARIARHIIGHIILDLANPDRSVCPLKTFRHAPEIASKHAFTTYTRLFKFELGRDEAVALSEALVVASINGKNALGQRIEDTKTLQEVLLATDDAAAQRVGRHLRMWSNFPFARALFDPSLDPIDYNAPAIVLRTYGLPAATADEQNNEHLFKRLSPEKLYVEAVYELTGQAIREHYFTSPKICSIYLPEAWHLATRPVGVEMIEICAHDSRKHGVNFWQDGHLATDWLPGQTALMGIKLVGRTEEEAALNNLERAGLHPEHNPEFFGDVVSGFTPGRFHVRFFDQIGTVQLFLPTDAELRASMSTTFRAAS